MARKTSSTPAKAKAAPKKAAKRPAKKTAAKASDAPPSEWRRVFSLQVGNTFSLLTERVEGGFVTMQQPIAPDAWLEVFYWKEPQQLARPDSKFTSVKLHARVDGEEQPVLELGSNDESGRFVRRSATLEVTATTQRIEYWFEISMSTGETVWDSNWGNNYWLDVASHASLPVEVLYDASMDSSLTVD